MQPSIGKFSQTSAVSKLRLLLVWPDDVLPMIASKLRLCLVFYETHVVPGCLCRFYQRFFSNRCPPSHRFDIGRRWAQEAPVTPRHGSTTDS